jgi:glycosyltransferase involved in cell wall biosynthesis
MSNSVQEEGVTVIICTFNGASMLPETINRLNMQEVGSGIPWEVIVVDNACTDNSSQIAQQVWARSDATLTVVKEPVPGLSFARNRGVCEARFEYISFIDDDNWVAEDWVHNVYNVFRDRPDINICGGQVRAACEVDPPHWFHNYANCYAVGKQCETTGCVPNHRGYLFGAGLTLRRSAFRSLLEQGFRSLLSDRTGDMILAGGDSEICYAFRLAGWKLWYQENLKIQHFIPEHRLTWEYFCKMQQGFGAAYLVLETYQQLLSKEIHFINLPPYYTMVADVVFKLWRLRQLALGPRSPETIENSVVYEWFLGRFRHLLNLGPTGFRGLILHLLSFAQGLRGKTGLQGATFAPVHRTKYGLPVGSSRVCDVCSTNEANRGK